jgi:threonine dehydrogenase-like Zn-dependent dehydrogenase
MFSGESGWPWCQPARWRSAWRRSPARPWPRPGRSGWRFQEAIRHGPQRAAVAFGASQVRYTDTDPHRVEAAAAFGADAARHDGPWPRHFDPASITVDVTGDSDGLATVIRSTARHGHCTGLAIDFNATTPLPLVEMYTRGITFHTSRADSLRYLPDVLNLLITTTFSPVAIPTTIRPWDQATRAWLQPAIKLVITR